MPCLHKFHNYLNLQRIDFAPNTLLVGTFNPAWPAGNAAEWLYGRVGNNYCWDVLPRLHDAGLNLRWQPPEVWKAFCSQYGIALTDIIFCINDADQENEQHRQILGSYQDAKIAEHFHDFTLTDIVGLLREHPTIQNVYLTRLQGIALFDQQWAEVEAYGEQHGLHVRNLRTPSKNARFHMRQFRQEFPNMPEPLRNFIHWSWAEQWHF
ncbi:hypothetical protein [Spirosoma sordidisoli]|uniref:Uncharacterized protein n=1 Tax=Spirosoma sordidisoli TaxID=2502893 RepID=A0A4Q2ULC7_9BACT|nr:hypothetical protein [Spirosoma sordidisoli]RYC70026.1 hypothetical protein EQG79_09145 [Spirosoma sordidisoli]